MPIDLVAVKSAVKSLGGLDILVNNAGILNDVTWQKMIETNFVSNAVSFPEIQKLNELVINKSVFETIFMQC